VEEKSGQEQAALWEASDGGEFASDGKVIQGRDGWLFIANDTNRLLEQHTGAVRLSEPKLEQWRTTLESRAARFDDNKIPSVVVFAPNTHSIYPELLPDGYPLSEERPVRQLLRHLEAAGSPIEPLHPLEALKAAKSTRPVCFSIDGHWNDFGAYLAYRLIIERLHAQGLQPRLLDDDGITFVERDWPGHLAVKAGLPGRPQYFAEWPASGRIVYDNAIINRGHKLVLESDAGTPRTCMVLADSYGYRLLWFLAESFRRVVYANLGGAIDWELIEEERPDVVIQLWAERFLIATPDDGKEFSLRDLEAHKRAKGRVRPHPTSSAGTSPHSISSR
jgi:alginate O-acetyltransferase complex protein AlgJ